MSTLPKEVLRSMINDGNLETARAYASLSILISSVIIGFIRKDPPIKDIHRVIIFERWTSF